MANSPDSAAQSAIPMHELKWSHAEKLVARKAFDMALGKELEALIREAKGRAARIEEPPELWALEGWLTERLEHLLAHERNLDRLKDSVAARCREVRIEPFTPDRVDRLVRSAIAGFEDEFSRGLTDGLPLHVQQGLDALLADGSDSGRVPLHELRADPGPISIETLEGELDKLRRLRGLALPVWLFGRLAPEIVQGYRRRAARCGAHRNVRQPAACRRGCSSDRTFSSPQTYTHAPEEPTAAYR